MLAIEKSRRELKLSLQQIFNDMDKDQNHFLSRDEVQEVAWKNPQLVQKLESLGIDCINSDELLEMFDSLHTIRKDAEGRGDARQNDPDWEPTISIDELVTALAGIAGPASQKDTFLLRQEVKVQEDRLKQLQQRQDEMAKQQMEMSRVQNEMLLLIKNLDKKLSSQ